MGEGESPVRLGIYLLTTKVLMVAFISSVFRHTARALASALKESLAVTHTRATRSPSAFLNVTAYRTSMVLSLVGGNPPAPCLGEDPLPYLVQFILVCDLTPKAGLGTYIL